MIKLLSISLALFIQIPLIAQRFDYYYRSTDDDWFINAIEDSQGNFYLLCVEENIVANNRKSLIIKLDNQGEFLKKYELSNFPSFTTFTASYIDATDNLYVMGVLGNDNTGLRSLNFWKFDASLNLKWSKGFGTNSTEVWSDQLNFDKETNEFYFVGYENQNNYRRPFIGKVDLNGDSIVQKFHDYGGNFTPYFEIQKRNREFLISALFVPYPTLEYASQLIVLDSNLNLDTAIYLNGVYDNIVGQVVFGNRVSLNTIGDSSILVSGRVDNMKTIGKKELDYACMRLHGNLKDDTTFVVETNQIREQPGFSNISRNGEHLYGALLSGFNDGNPYYDSSINNFYLAKLDKSGRVIKNFHYSNNGYLTYSGVLATNDGGALIYGASYLNGFNGEQERDAYAIKVDSNGEANITPAGMKQVIHPISFKMFPNPASTELTIEFDQFTQDERLIATIFNIHGQNISSTVINESMAVISLSNLLKGMYFVRIESQNNHITRPLIIE